MTINNLPDHLINSLKSWLKDYENEPEHDNDFCIELKDSACELFSDILKVIDRERNPKEQKPFVISCVCRDDILGQGYPQRFVSSLDDANMSYMAGKMSDAFCETDTYWIALEIICDKLLEEYNQEHKTKLEKK